MSDEKWHRKAEFFLTVIGFNLGVGTIWKFPYMCARDGGGSFIVPFLIFTAIGSVPLTYLETFIGQYSQLDVLNAWQICPAFKGLAFGFSIVSLIFFIYAPVLLAWILYYLFFSFSATLPWTSCGNSWNTNSCLPGVDAILKDSSNSSTPQPQVNATGQLIPAAEEFFFNNVLQITSGIDDMGKLRWPLAGCLFIVSLCVYLCIVNGIRISGKVVYFTVIAPYILVTAILVRACALPGSLDGILYYIVPDFEKLADPKIWMEACGVSIYFVEIGFGCLIKMASHNKINNNCLRDAIYLNMAYSLSLVYFGFSVFAVTGHLAYRRGTDMATYSSSGFKLGFIVYPEATSLLPLPQLWSVILFLMLFTLGLDTICGGLSASAILMAKSTGVDVLLIPPAEFLASVLGAWVKPLRHRRWLLHAIVVFVSYILALPYTMQGGVYLMTLVEWFAFFPSLVMFGFIELIVVAWIYGTSRVEKIMIRKSGHKLPKIMAVLWRYVCPILLMAVFCYSFYSYRPPRFEDFVYEPWANVLGWCISITTISPVPVYFIWTVWKSPGASLRERVKASLKPRVPWAETVSSSELENMSIGTNFDNDLGKI